MENNETNNIINNKEEVVADTLAQTPRLSKLQTIDWEVIPLKVLSFLFPFLSILSAFAIMELYPIGDRTMLTVDCYHQYAPFLCEFREKLISGRSLFYSWDCGLGNEYYAAFANYTSSPLNLLVVFFTPKAVPVFIAFITAVRAGLASRFMSMFLSGEDDKRYDYITVIFGATYALCGWFLTDFWNIMWCDAVVLLPLVCLGLRRLITDGKYTLYVLALAITLISNYYTGYFICLFLVLFAPVYYLILCKPHVKTFFLSAFRFAFGSLIAGMISAFITIPTYLVLQHSSATNGTFPKDYELTGNLFDFLGRFMVAANPNIRDGLANVFCGAIVVLLVPLFFMANEKTGITLRMKIGLGVLITILYLSFSNRTLNYIWHGFHFPNQIPYRESFLMSFLLVYMAFVTIRAIRCYSAGQISGVLAGALVFVVLYEKFGSGNETYIQIGLSFLFILIQGSVLRMIKTGKRSPAFYSYVITATMLVEMFATSCVTISLVAEHEGFTGYDFYGKNRTAVRNYVSSVENTEGHLSFERSEMYPNNICCMQSVYDVKGMSIFSSTARESLVKYMRNFGFHNNGINGLRNAGLTRVTATLLNIRNFIAVDNAPALPSVFEEEYRDGYITAYGNPDALSVGYMVSPEILDYVPEFSLTDVFAKTNSLVRSMGVVADVYLPIDVINVETSNMNYKGVLAASLTYEVANSSSASSMTVSVSGAEIGSEVYLYVDSSKSGRVEITRGEDPKQIFDIRSYQTICLGIYDGTPIQCKITYNTSPNGSLHLYAYEINQAGYQQMLDDLSDEQLEVTYYDDTTLRGTVTANEDGVLFLTVQYNEGFKLLVDGKEAELLSVNDALCAVELTAGTHTIELTYMPPMFVPALGITSVGVVLYAACVAIRKYVTKRKEVA